ncbi:E3 ubiquitin-protein ligase MIB2-like isoform X1, partial [Leptotrombidium deliense]
NASLLYLSSIGEIKLIRKLIAEGVNLNYKDSEGNTAIHKAAEYNDAEAIKILLKNGADINAVNHDGNTALHVAVLGFAVECVNLLLSKKIKLNLFNVQDASELLCALKLKTDEELNPVKTNLKNEIIGLLIDQENIDLRCVNKRSKAIFNGSNYLLFAIRQGNLFAVKKILQNEPALLNIKDKAGYYPIHCAVKHDKIEIIKHLMSIDQGLLNMRGRNEMTPLNYAICRCSLHVAQYLVECGANAHLADGDGNTPLHNAIYEYENCCKRSSVSDQSLKSNETSSSTESDSSSDNESNSSSESENDCKHELVEIFKEKLFDIKPKCNYLAVSLYLIENANASIYITNYDEKSPLDVIEDEKNVAKKLLLAYIQKQAFDQIQKAMKTKISN